MDIKRALWTGALLWIFIFFEVSVLMFGLKLSGTVYYTLHYILLLFLIVICCIIYFKEKKVKKNSTQGLYLGIFFVLVGLLLDVVITVPLFVKSYSTFFNNAMIFGFLETIIVTVIYSSIKK